MRLLKYIAALVVLVQAGNASAQTDSLSGDSLNLGYMEAKADSSSTIQKVPFAVKHEDYFETLNKDGYISQDTSLTDFQYYHPLYRKYVGFQHLGNIGSAYKNLYFTPQKKPGFDFGIHTFDEYLYDAEEATYHNVDTPITQLWYSQGAENQIYLRAMHTQNFGERFNFGVNFRRLASDGLYFNQATDYYNTQLVTNYTNPTYRYKVYANVTFNRMDNIENGGIRSDSIFGTLQAPNRLPGVLLNARNTYKSNAYYIKQEYNLTKAKYRTNIIDSNRTDTMYYPEYYTPKLVHEVSYSNNSWSYIDEAHDSLLYRHFYDDDIATFDSNNIKTLSNTVALLYKKLVPEKLYIELRPYYKNELIDLNELQGYSANYNNNAVGVDAEGKSFGSYFDMKFNAEKYISGYNKNDQNLKLLVSKKLSDYRIVSFTYHSQKVQPGFSQRYYSSNNYFFSNSSFVKEEVNRVRLTYVSNAKVDSKINNHFMVSAENKTVNNYIYYDTNAVVQQANSAINVSSFTVQKNFTYGRMHLNNEVVYQISNNDSILRLPDFMSKHSLFYEATAFHKALNFQIGVNLFYTSDFRGYAYSPALRQFYLQDEATIGGYPQFDVFMVGKVKSFLFSLKMEHVNEGFSGNRYYASAHHPLNGRVFRLGLAWRLID